ncbi:hypothetical protein Btru_054378 [Bulinus truncatus]|nr:hypothetical protein Btru_054378 [Bulinus truncatus]
MEDDQLASGSGEVVPMAWLPSPNVDITTIKQTDQNSEASGLVLATPAVDAVPMATVSCEPSDPSSGMNFIIVAEAAAEEATSALYQDLDSVQSAWVNPDLSSSEMEAEDSHAATSDMLTTVHSEPAIDCGMHTILSHLSDLSDDTIASTPEESALCHSSLHRRRTSGPSSVTCNSPASSNSLFRCSSFSDRNDSGSSSDFLAIDQSSSSDDAWDPLNPYGLFNLPEPVGSSNNSRSRQWDDTNYLHRERDGYNIFNLNTEDNAEEEHMAQARVSSPSTSVDLFSSSLSGVRAQSQSHSMRRNGNNSDLDSWSYLEYNRHHSFNKDESRGGQNLGSGAGNRSDPSSSNIQLRNQNSEAPTVHNYAGSLAGMMTTRDSNMPFHRRSHRDLTEEMVEMVFVQDGMSFSLPVPKSSQKSPDASGNSKTKERSRQAWDLSSKRLNTGSGPSTSYTSSIENRETFLDTTPSTTCSAMASTSTVSHMRIASSGQINEQPRETCAFSSSSMENKNSVASSHNRSSSSVTNKTETDNGDMRDSRQQLLSFLEPYPQALSPPESPEELMLGRNSDSNNTIFQTNQQCTFDSSNILNTLLSNSPPATSVNSPGSLSRRDANIIDSLLSMPRPPSNGDDSDVEVVMVEPRNNHATVVVDLTTESDEGGDIIEADEERNTHLPAASQSDQITSSTVSVSQSEQPAPELTNESSERAFSPPQFFRPTSFAQNRGPRIPVGPWRNEEDSNSGPMVVRLLQPSHHMNNNQWGPLPGYSHFSLRPDQAMGSSNSASCELSSRDHRRPSSVCCQCQCQRCLQETGRSENPLRVRGHKHHMCEGCAHSSPCPHVTNSSNSTPRISNPALPPPPSNPVPPPAPPKPSSRIGNPSLPPPPSNPVPPPPASTANPASMNPFSAAATSLSSSLQPQLHHHHHHHHHLTRPFHPLPHRPDPVGAHSSARQAYFRTGGQIIHHHMPPHSSLAEPAASVFFILCTTTSLCPVLARCVYLPCSHLSCVPSHVSGPNSQATAGPRSMARGHPVPIGGVGLIICIAEVVVKCLNMDTLPPQPVRQPSPPHLPTFHISRLRPPVSTSAIAIWAIHLIFSATTSSLNPLGASASSLLSQAGSDGVQHPHTHQSVPPGASMYPHPENIAVTMLIVIHHIPMTRDAW